MLFKIPDTALIRLTCKGWCRVSHTTSLLWLCAYLTFSAEKRKSTIFIEVLSLSSCKEIKARVKYTSVSYIKKNHNINVGIAHLFTFPLFFRPPLKHGLHWSALLTPSFRQFHPHYSESASCSCFHHIIVTPSSEWGWPPHSSSCSCSRVSSSATLQRPNRKPQLPSIPLKGWDSSCSRLWN